ncbi:hypothetical protein [Metabacillus idriensis]|nr:hypothetical protein [Metabacillus idriensis]
MNPNQKQVIYSNVLPEGISLEFENEIYIGTGKSESIQDTNLEC